MKKEKEKELSFWWAVGGIMPSREQGARGRECAGPAAAQGRRWSGRARATASPRGPHARESRRGGNSANGRRRGEPALRGENPAAGGLDGDSPPVTRFLGNG
jgi:hypothetical protein